MREQGENGTLLYILIDLPLAGSWEFNEVLKREHFAAGLFFWLAERLRTELTLKYGRAEVQVVRYTDDDLRGYSLKLSVGLEEEVLQAADHSGTPFQLTEELESRLQAMLESSSIHEYAAFFARNRKLVAQQMATLFA